MISATLFLRNAARNYLGSGGAVRIRGEDVWCDVFDSTIFSLNEAELDGGGMHASDIAGLHVGDTTFVGNEVRLGGGAAFSVLVRVF